MSKSVGNVVDPIALVDEFGLDQVRYFLLREVPFGQDGSYSEDAIIGRINTDLANELGNLAQRSLSMVNKNLDGVVPQPGEFTDDDRELLALADGLLPKVRAHFDVPAMHLALEAIWLMLGAANRYFSAQEPWVLRKSDAAADQERFGTVLYTTLEVVRIAALLVQPVMPDSAAKLLDLLGQPADQRDIRRHRQPGWRLARRCRSPRACSRATRWSELHHIGAAVSHFVGQRCLEVRPAPNREGPRLQRSSHDREHQRRRDRWRIRRRHRGQPPAAQSPTSRSR